MERADDPDGLLLSMVDPGGVAFPKRHSWMVDPTIDLQLVAGAELVHALQLTGSGPPFVLCELPLVDLRAAGVEIRLPTALDAAIGEQSQWREQALPAGMEYVDLDVLGSAIGRVLWRP